MKFSRPKPKTVYLVTFLIWLITCLAFNAWKISAYINNPNDLDHYAHNWRFGGFVFAVFYLPIWLIALLSVLALEGTYFARRRRIR